MSTKPGFEVDKAGLEKLLERRGREFAVLELVQNALDEQGVTQVSVTLESMGGGYHRLTVADDAPAGFADLSHAYTLFAESKKKGDAEKRGRFNLGEKLVLACCRRATIVTTTGAIEWETSGGKWVRRSLGRRRDAGSVFEGELRMGKAEAEIAALELACVLVPDGITLRVNRRGLNEVSFDVARREPVAEWVQTLPTEIADAEGYLRRSERSTRVRAYEPLAGHTARLYELGIPVVEIDGAFDIDVRQKVPLNTDRDNVTPAYLREIRASTLNNTHALLSKEQVRGAWVDDAMESGRLTDGAAHAVMDGRYGEKRVVRDPSDPESTKIAVAQGYAVVEPGAFSRSAWDTIRRTSAVLPSGKVTPSPKVVFSEDGEDCSYPREKWSRGMRTIVAFTTLVARKLTGARVIVDVVNSRQYYAACFGNGELLFNVQRLGKDWFDREPMSEEVLRLIVHEVGHHWESDHLSERYHDALCRCAARLGALGADGTLAAYVDEARAEAARPDGQLPKRLPGETVKSP